MDLNRASRYLSYLLRHHPEAAGITLDAHGWADVDQLLAGMKKHRITRAQLEEIHLHKTGCLLTLPLLCAAVLAGHEEDLPILKQIGSLIGLSFQIQDDVMDVTESQQQLGKSNSDIANHKATFVTLMGVEDARALSDACYREAKALCAQLHLDTQGLLSLFDQLRERRS